MSKFVAIPIEMIAAPNYYAVLKPAAWTIYHSNAVTLWLRLEINDSVGQRPYTPASGSSLKVEFQRADLYTTDSQRLLTSTPQTIEKTANMSSDNRSLMSVALTASDTEKVVGGTVRFTLTEGTQVSTWVFNYAVKKEKTEAGF
jgi:hypothetical protein